jgi:RNA polymerase sigma-70 factor (ECF subfamily)
MNRTNLRGAQFVTTEWMKQETDGTLVTAVLSGERSAFAVLVQRYQGPLLRVALGRLGLRDWSEDVVQETFLCAFKSLHTYNSRYSFRTWLWTILLNQCRRHQRKRMRGARVWSDRDLSMAGGSAGITSDDLGPVDSLMVRERNLRLDRMLNQLPSVQADAIRLRFFGGLKFQEIADSMDCSLSTAKNRVRWGLTRLAQLIDLGTLTQRSSVTNNMGRTGRS